MLTQSYVISFVGAPKSYMEDRIGAQFTLSYLPINMMNLYGFLFNPDSWWDGVIFEDLLVADVVPVKNHIVGEMIIAGHYRPQGHKMSDLAISSLRYKRGGIGMLQMFTANHKQYEGFPLATPLPAGAYRRPATPLDNLSDASGYTIKDGLLTEHITPTTSNKPGGIIFEDPLRMNQIDKNGSLLMDVVLPAGKGSPRIGALMVDQIVIADHAAKQAAIETNSVYLLHEPRSGLLVDYTMYMEHESRFGLLADYTKYMEHDLRPGRLADDLSVLEREASFARIEKDLVDSDGAIHLAVYDALTRIADPGRKKGRLFEETPTAKPGIHPARLDQETLIATPPVHGAILDDKMFMWDMQPREMHMEELDWASAIDRVGHIMDDKTMLATDISSARPALLDMTIYTMIIKDEFTDLYDNVGRDERNDLMIIPNNDYPYEKNEILLYDKNGVPLNPLGNSSVADVKVPYPMTHPFPQWADVANREIWVNLWPLKDVMMILVQIWRQDVAKFAGMTMQEALEFLLTELYTMIEDKFKTVPDYYRVFRLTRWYAERIIMNNTDVILHREYDKWRDRFYIDGTFGLPSVDAPQATPTATPQATPDATPQVTPATPVPSTPIPSDNLVMDGFVIDAGVGAIQSMGGDGYLRFTITNFVNGLFTMSAKIDNGNDISQVEVIRDHDTTIWVLGYDGLPHQRSFPVDAGTHTFEIRWTPGGIGPNLMMSGFSLTGVVFKGATTSFHDPGSIQGSKAIHLLTDDLMKYYKDHWDQFKTKGSMAIAQRRKVWMEL